MVPKTARQSAKGAAASVPKTASKASPSASKPKATQRKASPGGRKVAKKATPKKQKKTFRSLVKTMELMREACLPYDWSRSSWKLRVGESFLLDPKANDKSDLVTYRDELQRSVTGRIYVTTFQLRFYPSRHVKLPAAFFRVPLGTIDRITVIDDGGPSSSMLSSTTIIIHCKDHRTLRFIGQRKKILQLQDLLRAFVFPSGIDLAFAFQATTELEKLRKRGELDIVAQVEKFRGRGPRYDFVSEFTRLGVIPEEGSESTGPWRVSQLNNTYEFAPTYPGLNIMPKQFTDAELRALGGFRSKCRVPSMSW